MNTHIIMDARGDTRHEFDASDVIAFEQAQQRFRELTEKGYRAVALGENGKPNSLLRDFDPAVKKTLFVPQLQGG